MKMRPVLKATVLAASACSLFSTAYGYYEGAPLELSKPHTNVQPQFGELYESMNIPFSDEALFSTDESGLHKRQQRTCNPGYELCTDGVHCAKIGDYCCGGGSSSTCRKGSKCCPGQPVCAPEGFFCCKDQANVCPTGGKCCPEGKRNCAPPGGECCGDGYCEEGEQCCGAGKGCASKGNTCCGDKQCTKGTKCCVDEDGDHYCAKSCVPSLIFPYLEGLLDEVYENMCRGLAQSSRTGDSVSDILTLESKSKDALKKIKAKRRRDARCTGSKKIQCPPGYNCDEFLFASTAEGGSGAQIECIPVWQNDWQGIYFNSWLQEMLNSGKLKRGGQFRVVIKGLDCSKFKKRDKSPVEDPILNQDGNVTILSSKIFGNYSDGKNAMLIPLTQDGSVAGKYTIDYSLSEGSVVSGAIIDSEGQHLENISSLEAGSSNKASVELGRDFGDITLLGWTEDKKVDIKYNVESTPATSSTPTETAEPTETGKTSNASSLRSSPGSILAIVVFAVGLCYAW